MKNAARVHPSNIDDNFAVYASPFVRHSFAVGRVLAGWSSREDPTGGDSVMGMTGRLYRSSLVTIIIVSAILILVVWSDDAELFDNEAIRVTSILFLISMVLVTTAFRLSSCRGAMYESLLYELEHKAINDLKHFRKTKERMNHAHHGLILSTKDYVMTTSLSNLDMIHGYGDKDDAVGTVDSMEKGGDEDVFEVRRGLGEESSMRDFYAPLQLPSYICWSGCLVAIVILISLGTDLRYTPEVRFGFLIVGICFIFFGFGEIMYGFISLVRWINVATHSIECWGYSVVELVDRSSCDGAVSEAQMLNFRAKLDALHDMHAVPLAFLNQKMSTAASTAILGCLVTAMNNIANLYVPGYSSGYYSSQIIMTVYMLSLAAGLVFYCGQITEAFGLARETIKRPRVIAALKPLLGSDEQVEILLKHYFLDERMGFKLLGTIFSHYTSLGVLMTLFVGILFSFGPSIAEAMI